MSIIEFTKRIEDLFEDVSLEPTSDFRANDEFDSLIGYSILVTIEDIFGVRMSVQDFLRCKTVEDLFHAING